MKKTTYTTTFYLRLLQMTALVLTMFSFITHFSNLNVYLFVFAFYWYSQVGLSVAMHRYFSHRAFQTSRWGSYFLSFWAVLSMVGSPIFWAVIHRQHHQYSDTPQDPHGYRTKGKINILLGFWYNDIAITRAELNDLLKEDSLSWAHRHYFKIIFVWVVFLFLLNRWAPVFYYFAPVILGVLLLNLNLILHHKIGYKNFDTNDLSRNNWIMFPLSFGECWHNNHHQFPRQDTTKVRWWEFDPGIIVVRLLQRKSDRLC
jgi:stearoyl-CoA desaturase (delta-9 desaturase)